MTVSSEFGLPSRWATVERRLPENLADLCGPNSGVVSLPLHLVWSGIAEFNLDDRNLLLSFYRTLINVGQRGDMARYLNRELLQQEWPTLRMLVARPLREAWEAHFPALGFGYEAK